MTDTTTEIKVTPEQLNHIKNVLYNGVKRGVFTYSLPFSLASIALIILKLTEYPDISWWIIGYLMFSVVTIPVSLILLVIGLAVSFVAAVIGVALAIGIPCLVVFLIGMLIISLWNGVPSKKNKRTLGPEKDLVDKR